MYQFAPIVLFVYKRPEHTLRTLTSLASNVHAKNSVLYVFADGPRADAEEAELVSITQTMRVVKSAKWCRDVIIVQRGENLGLSKNIVDGVSRIVNMHGRAIVLEDDMVCSPFFLNYMNDALIKYQNDENVACISGYNYPVKKMPDSFFLLGADCWGWATWERAWHLFEEDGTVLLHQLQKANLEIEFDFGGAYPYTQMLKNQIAGRNDSWAVRWYASCFLQNKYCLYPGKSFIENIGEDGSGIHCGAKKKTKRQLNNGFVLEKNSVTENLVAKRKIAQYLRSQANESSFEHLSRRWISAIGGLYRKIRNVPT